MSLSDTLNYYSNPYGAGANPAYTNGVTTAAPTSTIVDPLNPTATAPLPEMAGGGGANTLTGKGVGDVGGGNLAPGAKNTFGWNLGSLDLVLGGIKTIGGLWAAWQENKLAKEQLKLQQQTTNANFANQVSAYNTALEDKTRHRASFNELPQAEADAYLASHKLDKVNIG